MPRVGVIPVLGAAWLGFATLARCGSAQTASALETVGDVRVPGGLQAAADVLRDRTNGLDAYYLLDLIRSSYDTRDVSVGSLQRLIAHLEKVGPTGAEPPLSPSGSPAGVAGVRVSDTLPLPLPEQWWIDVVFGGRARRETLLVDILRSRDAALLYYGLLSLDDETRVWLSRERALTQDVVARYAARFKTAAPAVRVASNRIRLPGGESAVAAWEALVGRSTGQPAEFLRTLLGADEGRLSAFVASLAELTEARLRFGLRLDASPGERGDALRRLYQAFARVSATWSVDDAPFARPTLDPARLLADLEVDDRGQPVLPGTRSFWSAVLEDAPPGSAPASGSASRQLVEGVPVDFPWLCDELVKGGPHRYHRNHVLVLFASRLVKQVSPDSAADAVDAVRAAGTYPALATTLERAGVGHTEIFARAARRAALLTRIPDATRAARSLAQFQGALFVLARAASRGAWPAGAVDDAVSSLVAVEPGAQGDYEGRLVRWLAAFLDTRGRHSSGHAVGSADASVQPGAVDPGGRRSLDLDLLRTVAGESDASLPVVDWEGSRYRVDLAHGETTRLAGLLGEVQRPYVASAEMLVAVAEQLTSPGRSAEARQRYRAVLEAVRQAGPWERDIESALDRAARADPGRTSRLTVGLRLLADRLLARGLTQYAYAVALGQPSRTTVSVAELAGRHDFGVPGAPLSRAWHLPSESVDTLRGWHVSGSILGLDVTLADRTLVSVSSKPPPRPPTIDARGRQALTEAATLVRVSALTDADMRTIAAAMRRGRERVGRLRSPAEAASLADEIRLDPERRTVLAWTVARRPDWLATFFAPIELFWLGLEGAPIGATLHAWGAPVRTRTGCPCLRLDAPMPLGALVGRWDPALLASGFADLNLRLAELLSQLDMPAALLGPVLAAATLDLVRTAHMRDRGDRRGLESFVRDLGVDHVEQYLALLTTGGPLVPVGEVAGVERATSTTGGPR